MPKGILHQFLFKCIVLFLLTSLAPCYADPQHKIVYLISPPRSLSVAFLRMMQARGDFQVYNEYTNVFLSQMPPHPDFVKVKILADAQTANLFLKEIISIRSRFLTESIEMASNKNVYYIYLLRHPHPALISFYKKRILVRGEKDFDKVVAYNREQLASYQYIYENLQILKQSAVNKPYIILTESLSINPEQTIEKFSHYIGVPYKPESLKWQKLAGSFTPEKDWHDVKPLEAVRLWHSDAMSSQEFGKQTVYATDAQGSPTFVEIKNLKHREICQKAYLENLRYYNLLLHEKNLIEG